MADNGNCPLTMAHLDVIRTAHALGDTSSKAISTRLKKSRRTIDTEYQQIFDRTGVHSRYGIILLAEREGWIHPPEASGRPGAIERPASQGPPSGHT